MEIETTTLKNSRKWPMHMALFLFLLSLFLPAIYLDVGIMFGFLALYLSFIGCLMPPGLDDTLAWGQWSACLVGALANLLFLCSYASLVARCHFGRGPSFGRSKSLALTCVGLMLSTNIPLLLGSEEYYPHMGHGIWVAAGMLLAYGAYQHHQVATNVKANAPSSMWKQLPLIAVGPTVALVALVIEFLTTGGT